MIMFRMNDSRRRSMKKKRRNENYWNDNGHFSPIDMSNWRQSKKEKKKWWFFYVITIRERRRKKRTKTTTSGYIEKRKTRPNLKHDKFMITLDSQTFPRLISFWRQTSEWKLAKFLVPWIEMGGFWMQMKCGWISHCQDERTPAIEA